MEERESENICKFLSLLCNCEGLERYFNGVVNDSGMVSVSHSKNVYYLILSLDDSYGKKLIFLKKFSKLFSDWFRSIRANEVRGCNEYNLIKV